MITQNVNNTMGLLKKKIHAFYKTVTRKAEGDKRQNSVCCIFSICAKLGLLWQPESGPLPVAMVEKDRVMTFIQHQETFSILRVRRHSLWECFP